MPKRGELGPINHGTYGGAQAHVKRKIPIDKADSCGCREARRLYNQDLREGQRGKNRIREFNERVSKKVGARLMLRYPAETKELLTKFRSEVRAEMIKEQSQRNDELLQSRTRTAEDRRLADAAARRRRRADLRRDRGSQGDPSGQ